MSQLSYSINHGGAYAGMLADLQDKEIVSRAVETAAGIGFGVAVGRGTDAAKQVILGAAANVIGVTVRALNREVGADGSFKALQYESVDVLRAGYIWVAVPSGCAVGDKALSTDGTGVIDAGVAGAGQTQIAGATFETVAAAGGLALLRIASE